MRISDWSSDVCSSDLYRFPPQFLKSRLRHVRIMVEVKFNQTVIPAHQSSETRHRSAAACFQRRLLPPGIEILVLNGNGNHPPVRSEEHTSELQSLMRISYAVFCLKKQTNNHIQH